MGSGWGWLGSSAFPCLIFLLELVSSAASFAIIECSVRFDDTQVLRMLGGVFWITVLRFNVSDLGVPASRPRMYMLLLRKGRMRWAVENVQQTFQSVFFKI